MKHQISKLVTNGLHKEALSLYTHHHSASLPPHEFTFPPLLKSCTNLNSPIHGRILHTHLLKTGFLADVYTATALTAMYMKFNDTKNAIKVFDEMPHRNIASLNALISGFSQNGYRKQALRVFKEVGFECFHPNSVTLATVLPSCRKTEHGEQIHCLAVKLGVEMDVYVSTSLVTMYLNCRESVTAAKVFGDIPEKNLVSYNALLSGLLRNGSGSVVLYVFKEMRECLSEPVNSVTLVSVISASSSGSCVRFGLQVHGFVSKTEMIFDVMVRTSLVDMYSKCGCWKSGYDVFNEVNSARNLITWNSMITGLMSNDQTEIAVELFDRLRFDGLEPDSVTWNSMISGFSKLKMGFEAFKYFEKMMSSGLIKPNIKCITSLLPVCSDLSMLETGKEIHGYVTRRMSDITTDVFITTSLIAMYMQCGSTLHATRVFDRFKTKPDDPAVWNAMISGYGRNGEYENALRVFEEMKTESVRPNGSTFVGVLSACSQTGEVEKGCDVFRTMYEEYGLKQGVEHVGCVIDLLGRYGKLGEAWELIRDMSDKPSSVLSTLLGGCRHHVEVELGEEMARKLSELEPGSPTPFVLLSNIYASVGRWTDVERTREMIDDKRLRKVVARSSIGVARDSVSLKKKGLPTFRA